MDDRELFHMIETVTEQDDHSVQLWLKNKAECEYYPSLATYWMERLGRKQACQSQEIIQASSL